MARGGVSESKSKVLASVALLGGLAFTLRIAVDFPFPLASYLSLEVWEIPAYLALFIYGVRRGIAVAFTVFLLVQAFATGLPAGPLYNFIAVLSTMVGVFTITRATGKSIHDFFKSRKMAIASVVSSAITRILLMTIVNAIVLPLPIPIGFRIPPAALPPVLAVTAIFNGTVAVYSVAIALLLASRIPPSVTGIYRQKI